MGSSKQHAAGVSSIGFAALIGWRDGGNDVAWDQVRASQLRAGLRLAPAQGASTLVAIAVAAVILAGDMPLWQVAAWTALALAASAKLLQARIGQRRRPLLRADCADLRGTVPAEVATAATWALIPLLFGPHLSASGRVDMGSLLAVLMTATAFAMAPLTLATASFLAIVGGATALCLMAAGLLAEGIATLCFTAVNLVICVGRARALAMAMVNRMAIEERDETVSLLLREFQENGADWLWESDAARRIVKASPRFAFACGREAEALNGLPVLQVLAGADWDTGEFHAGLRTFAERLKQRESFRDLLLLVSINGAERWWELSASPRYDEGGNFCGFRGVGSDITEQRASADRIDRMARYDPLTALPNRLMVNEALARALSDAEQWGSRCVFMMLDLDRFKAVNDTLGHPIGDRLLGQVAERLARLMPAAAMCGRLGGDEFGIVMTETVDMVAVEVLARRIIDILSEPYEVDQHTLYIGASIGTAWGPRDGRTAETLIRSADLALYRAKSGGGGGCYAYEPQLHAQAEERRKLEIGLRKALERGELHLDYQPVVAADTGALTGFEALLRWTSPEFGPVSPVKFIPIAEEARLIGPIGEWVLRAACAEASSWPKDIRVAVNVSAEQLQTTGFVATVASALSNAGISAGQLELEVTESVFLHEGNQAVRTLERVLDLGVRLSLDDFGTGYSSLGYLSRTRFSSIKIDRSFVQSASRGEREATAIIRAVVALANSLGMGTTAEGVETEKEHGMVLDFGCTKVQGYYFGRPLPVAEARSLANRRWKDAAAA